MTAELFQLWLADPWVLVMVAALPLMWPQRYEGKLRWPKLRTWAALVLSSLVAWAVTPATGDVPVREYALICLIGAFIVITRPAGQAQYAIGVLFMLMFGWNFGLLAGHLFGLNEWASGTSDVGYHLSLFAGWMQAALIFSWGAVDGGKAVLAWRRGGGNSADRGALIGNAG